MDNIEEYFEENLILCPMCKGNFLYAQYWGGGEYKISCFNKCGFNDREVIESFEDFQKYKEKIEAMKK